MSEQEHAANQPKRYVLIIVIIVVIAIAGIALLLSQPVGEQLTPTNTPNLTYAPLGVSLVALVAGDALADGTCSLPVVLIVPERPVTGRLCVENSNGKACGDAFDVEIGEWSLAASLTDGLSNTVTFEGDFLNTPLTDLTCG